jgi:hypothetical protein
VAKTISGEVDSTLGDSRPAPAGQDIASANVGSDVTADQRKSAAAVVDNLYSQILTLANKQFEGMYLFAGDRLTDAPFVPEAGGVKFVGSANVLQNAFDENSVRPFMVDGDKVFGALSTRIQGTADLTPSVSAATRLADMSGVSSNGIRLGAISIGNGTINATVDLTNADTLGDVVDAINAAGVGGITATLERGASISRAVAATTSPFRKSAAARRRRTWASSARSARVRGLPLNGADAQPS